MILYHECKLLVKKCLIVIHNCNVKDNEVTKYFTRSIFVQLSTLDRNVFHFR